jgi:hypothetical protein
MTVDITSDAEEDLIEGSDIQDPCRPQCLQIWCLSRMALPLAGVGLTARGGNSGRPESQGR